MYTAALSALLTKLKASGELHTAVSGQWYVDIARSGYTFPYGLLVHNSGARRRIATAVKLGDEFWAVQVIGLSQDTNALLGDLVRAALDEAALTATATYGWNVYSCDETTALHNVEIEAGKAVYFDGGLYRLRLSA